MTRKTKKEEKLKAIGCGICSLIIIIGVIIYAIITWWYIILPATAIIIAIIITIIYFGKYRDKHKYTEIDITKLYGVKDWKTRLPSYEKTSYEKMEERRLKQKAKEKNQM